MSHFVEVPVDGQQTLVVEVDEPSEGSVVRAGRFRDVTATAVQTLDSAADGIKSAAGAFVTKMRSLEQAPKEIAIEIAKMPRSRPLARAVQRRRKPAMSRRPRAVSATVEATARNGIVTRGMNESTSPV